MTTNEDFLVRDVYQAIQPLLKEQALIAKNGYFSAQTTNGATITYEQRTREDSVVDHIHVYDAKNPRLPQLRLTHTRNGHTCFGKTFAEIPPKTPKNVSEVAEQLYQALKE